MSKPATIAIDGPGAVGKNTIGILLARRLGYRFLDTGAMYRALTWHVLQCGIDLSDEEKLSKIAAESEIDLTSSGSNDGHCLVLVNGRDVSLDTRREEVERGVSLVAKVAGVRRAMVAKQQGLASKGKVVMVGRDIGTVVLPDADLKIYLSASPEERARRRYLELLERRKKANYDKVLTDLNRRDKLDSERALAPLQPAADAKIVNTDNLDVEQVLTLIVDLIEAG